MKVKRPKKNRQTNIAELEKIRALYYDQIDRFQAYDQSVRVIFSIINWFMETIIDTFKEFEGKGDKVRRQADDNWRVLQYYGDTIIEMNKEIKKLKERFDDDKKCFE